MADHYYTEQPRSDFNPYKIEINLSYTRFDLYSSNGVFSKDELDTASKHLIETVKDDVTGNVLDLGCGIGVIGISLDLYKKGLDITYSDINERCLTLVEKNLKHLGLEGEVVKSDGFEHIPDVYDTIVTNPPISAGLDTCFDLIRNAHEHLEDGGRLFVVAKHTKGGERLQKEMRKVFGNNSITSSKKGFKVYTSRKR